MRIPQKTARNYMEKKRICRVIMRMSKRNKKDFPKKDENFSENKEKLHGEENDQQDNNENTQKKQGGTPEEG